MTGFLIAVSLCVPGSTVDLSNPPPAYAQAAMVDLSMDACFCDCRWCCDRSRRDRWLFGQGWCRDRWLFGQNCHHCLCSVVDSPPQPLPRPPLRPQHELWQPVHDLMLPPPNSFLLHPQLDHLLLPCQYDLLGGLDLDSPIGQLPPDPRDPAFTPMGPELGLVNPVPEPSALALLVVAAAIVVRRRK